MTAREFIEMGPKKNWARVPGAAREFVENSENWRDADGVKMRSSGTGQTVHVAENRIRRILLGRIKCTGCGTHDKNGKWHPGRGVQESVKSVTVKSWVQYEDCGDPEKLGLQFDSGKGFMLDVNLVCKTSDCQRIGSLQIQPDPLMGDLEFFEQNIDTYRLFKDGE